MRSSSSGHIAANFCRNRCTTLLYERIGVINWDYYKPGFRAPSITDILPELRRKAWAVGGDALVIRSMQAGAGTARNLRVLVDVIRWR